MADAPSTSCLSRFDACEKSACATGTAWGLLSSPLSMLAWWFVRHSVYFAAAAFLLMVEPFASSTAVYVLIVAVMLVAHSWKVASFFIRNRDALTAPAAVSPTANKVAPIATMVTATITLGSGRSSGLGLGVVSGSVQVVSLGANTPGANAGLQRGDTLVTVDGEACGADVGKVQRYFARASGGVVLTLQRTGALVAADAIDGKSLQTHGGSRTPLPV